MRNTLSCLVLSLLSLGYCKAQQAPNFRELLDSALVRDAELKLQQNKNKVTSLDQHKLKDIFLPTLELSGTAGYMNATMHLVSPEINLQPFLNIPEGKDRITTASVSMARRATRKGDGAHGCSVHAVSRTSTRARASRAGSAADRRRRSARYRRS